jgi:ABC-type polysaccharide/polyol phosphate export permease
MIEAIQQLMARPVKQKPSIGFTSELEKWFLIYLLYGAVATLILFLLGVILFNRMEKTFIDKV